MTESRQVLSPEQLRIQNFARQWEAAHPGKRADEYWDQIALDFAASELPRLRSQGAGQWISVEERLPEFTGTYLVAVNGPSDDGEEYTGTLAADWLPKDKRWYDLRGWGNEEVTHWQPLPSPPSPAGLTSPPENVSRDTFKCLKCSEIKIGPGNCPRCGGTMYNISPERYAASPPEGKP